MRTFEYFKPTSLQEALDLLEKYNGKAKVIAGGTDAMIQWKKRLLSPECFISLRNIPELNYIEHNGSLGIGSATPHRKLELSPIIQEHFPVLTDAVTNLGSVQVRCSATIGGNICNAAPSADTAPPLLVLDTEVHIAGPKGKRTVPLAEFFGGPKRTVLESSEIVTHFLIPKLLPRTGAAYWKHTRRKAMDLPILGVACLLSFEEDMTTCAKACIGLGVAAPTPIRAPKAEEFLVGKPVNEDTLTEAGTIAADEASPRNTIRGSQWYRTDMIRVLVKRTGLTCLDRAKGASR